jgi:hypothetical protein
MQLLERNDTLRLSVEDSFEHDDLRTETEAGEFTITQNLWTTRNVLLIELLAPAL